MILPPTPPPPTDAPRGGEEEQWRVERVSFAAHCPRTSCLGITEKLMPRQIILIHGSAPYQRPGLQAGPEPQDPQHPRVGETVRTVLWVGLKPALHCPRSSGCGTPARAP